MKTFLNHQSCLTITFIALITFPLAGQVKFDSDKYAQKGAKQYKSVVRVNAEDFSRFKITHLLIEEFQGEYQFSPKFEKMAFTTNHQGDANYRKYLTETHGKLSKRMLTPGADYFQTVTHVFYGMLARILEENELEYNDNQKLTQHPDYMAANLHRDMPAQLYQGGLVQWDDNPTFRALQGMGIFSNNYSYSDLVAMNGLFAKIGNDLGAQAALRVKFCIEANQDGAPVITRFDIYMDTYLTAYKQGKETVYKWKKPGVLLASLEKPFASQRSFIAEGATLEDFDKELALMLNVLAETFSYNLSEQI